VNLPGSNTPGPKIDKRVIRGGGALKLDYLSVNVKKVEG